MKNMSKVGWCYAASEQCVCNDDNESELTVQIASGQCDNCKQGAYVADIAADEASQALRLNKIKAL
jgi:hypothetical protein